MFVDARVKINDNREVLLTQKLLPVMRETCESSLSSSKAMFLLTERVRQPTF